LPPPDDTELLPWMQNLKCPLNVSFELPAPPVPARGWAQRIVRNELKATTAQDEFMFAAWKEDNKVTAPILREKIERHFVGQEEHHLLEFEVQMYLSRLYQRVKAGSLNVELAGLNVHRSKRGSKRKDDTDSEEEEAAGAEGNTSRSADAGGEIQAVTAAGGAGGRGDRGGRGGRGGRGDKGGKGGRGGRGDRGGRGGRGGRGERGGRGAKGGRKKQKTS
jgi:hypothetical protein